MTCWAPELLVSFDCSCWWPCLHAGQLWVHMRKDFHHEKAHGITWAFQHVTWSYRISIQLFSVYFLAVQVKLHQLLCYDSVQIIYHHYYHHWRNLRACWPRSEWSVIIMLAQSLIFCSEWHVCYLMQVSDSQISAEEDAGCCSHIKSSLNFMKHLDVLTHLLLKSKHVSSTSAY